MDKFVHKIGKINYIVVEENEVLSSGELFESLRTMSTSLQIDYSTISKKLNEGGGRCYATSKQTKKIFHIIKL